MVREGQTIVRMNGWDGGLVTEIDDVLLEIGESPSIVNMDIGLKGEIIRRAGFSKFSTSDPAGMGQCENLFYYSKLGTDEKVIYVDSDSDVWDGDSAGGGTTFAQSTVSGPVDVVVRLSQHDAVVFNATTGGGPGKSSDNTFFLTSGGAAGAKVYRWDATTWTAITDNTLDGGTDEFPQAVTLAVFADRIFAGSVGAEPNSLMHFSNINQGLTWGVNDFIIIDAGSQVIRKLVTLNDTLIVLKDRQTYVLSGLSVDTFNLRRASEKYGTISPKSVINMGNEIIWYDSQNGVVSFDGTDFNLIDQNVRTRILASAAASTSHQRDIFAFRRRNRYYLSLETGVPGRITYVYDLETESWSEYDYGVNGFVFDDTNNTFYGGQNVVNGKGIWEMHKAADLDDASTLITSTFKTPWFSPEPDGSFIDTHRLLKMIPYFSPASGPTPVKVTVALYTDFNNNTVLESKVVA